MSSQPDVAEVNVDEMPAILPLTPSDSIDIPAEDTTSEPVYARFSQEKAEDRSDDSQDLEDLTCLRSMKSVLRALKTIGIEVTWTSFHRYCVEEAMRYPVALADELHAYGLNRDDLYKIAILYVPKVLKNRIMVSLGAWLNGSECSDSHFFASLVSITRQERAVEYKRISSEIKQLSDRIMSVNGHADNVTYLREVYGNSVEAFSGVVPDRFNIGVWLKAVNASHDAVIEALPRTAALYVGLRIGLSHGEQYENARREQIFKDDVDESLDFVFQSMRLGSSARVACDEVFDSLSQSYRDRKLQARTFVTEACERVAEEMARWCQMAFTDHIAHVKLMDPTFCRYFKDSFGADVWSKRFAIANSYAKF